jgi:hypothetical protein
MADKINFLSIFRFLGEHQFSGTLKPKPHRSFSRLEATIKLKWEGGGSVFFLFSI